MKLHRATPFLATALFLSTAFVVPEAAAGQGYFGLSLGNSHFNLTLGVGNWDVYSHAWTDPAWSLNYETSLAGYGEWIYVSGLGNVWRPWVATDWRPYTHGRWVYTSYGWTWVAYEPWGYFPHHYGNWAFTTFGWVWTPGYTYHAANVVWIGSGSYLGWYACPPHGWSHAHRGRYRSYSRGYAHGHSHGYRQGYWDGWRDARYATFIDRHHMVCDNVSRHARSHHHVTHASRSSVGRLHEAPTRSTVSRWTRSPVSQVGLDHREARIGQRSVTMARPHGSARSVERHAGTTVERALSPAVSRQFEQTRGAVARHSKPESAKVTAASTARSRTTHRRTALPRSTAASPSRSQRVATHESSRGTKVGTQAPSLQHERRQSRTRDTRTSAHLGTSQTQRTTRQSTAQADRIPARSQTSRTPRSRTVSSTKSPSTRSHTAASARTTTAPSRSVSSTATRSPRSHTATSSKTRTASSRSRAVSSSRTRNAPARSVSSATTKTAREHRSVNSQSSQRSQTRRSSATARRTNSTQGKARSDSSHTNSKRRRR